MSDLLGLLTAFGVSAPAGLNAYLPLLVVGLTARFTTWLTLNEPFHWLANEWVLLALTVLLLVEFFADKVPGVDHVNDLVNTVIRPTAGAVLFAASSNVISDLHPALAIILGVVAAGSVHALKATTRPAVTVATAGLGNPVVSVIEDLLAVLATLAAIVAPVVMLGAVLALTTIAFFVLRRHLRRPEPRPLR